METHYEINGVGYTLYQAASGDYCVTVETYENKESYNLGSRENALEFILADHMTEDE